MDVNAMRAKLLEVGVPGLDERHVTQIQSGAGVQVGDAVRGWSSAGRLVTDAWMVKSSEKPGPSCLMGLPHRKPGLRGTCREHPSRVLTPGIRRHHEFTERATLALHPWGIHKSSVTLWHSRTLIIRVPE